MRAGNSKGSSMLMPAGFSGVFEGVTTGTPIGLLIRNVDARSKDYGSIKDTFRPGHAEA